MSKTFSLDLKQSPEITVEYKGLEVTIKPLDKREDQKLVDKHTKGKISVLQERPKKGFRRKEGGKDEVTLPDTNYLELNIERATKTWIRWNITDNNDVPVPCNKENIEAFFSRYYDMFALRILERYDEQVNGMEEDEDEGKY